MKALLLADLHGSRPILDQLRKSITKYDIVLCAGDLTDFGWPQSYVDELSEVVGKIPFYWVSGNNDVAQDYQYRQNNLINIDGRVIEFKGLKLAGLGGSAPNYEGQNYGPTLDRETDLSDTILITHIPPSRPLHYQKDDIVCNNETMKQLSHAPSVHLCGHIHNIFGTACLGQTKVIKIGTAKTGQWAELDTNSLFVSFYP